MINSTPIYNYFKYVSAECGSGKTSAVCKIINESGSTDRYILVQNTIALIEKTSENLNDVKIIVTNTTSENDNVITSVIDFLKRPDAKTLMITDKTFFRIPCELLRGWYIYIDDVTNFHSFQNINEDNHDVKGVILSLLVHNVESLDDNNTYISAERKPNSGGELISAIRNKLSVFNDNDIFIMNNEFFTDPQKVQLNITAMKDLNKYTGLPITFLGANFEKSLIFKGNNELFEKSNLEGLQTREIELRDRLKVFYFSKNRKLSKTWKNENPYKIQKIYDYLNQELKDQEFYWTNNNGDAQSLQGGLKISPDARGFDHYSNYTKCVWLACMRPSEAEAKHCELFFKINGEDIHIAREYEGLHQFALRGISRVFSSTETQIVNVFDEWQARSLSDNIEYIDLGIDDEEQGQKGRPQGSPNKEKRFTLDDTKAARFRRWKKANPELNLEVFRAFIASTTNADLSTEDIKAMYDKYDKAVQKKQK